MPLIATLTDSFDDNVVDPVKWVNSYGTFAEVGGRARISCDAGFSAYASDTTYTLDESSWYCKMTSPADGGATSEAWLQVIILTTTPGTDAGIEVNGATGNIVFFSRVGYFDPSAVTLTFDPVAHAWVRLRETGGNLFFDTSPDFVVWTNRYTLSSPAWVTDTDLQVQLIAHRDGGTDDFGFVDDFNFAPITGTVSSSIAFVATMVGTSSSSVTGSGGVTTTLPAKLQIRPLTIAPYNELLDLQRGRGQRRTEFHFYLVDALTGQVYRELQPYRDSVPKLTHDTTRTIKRGLDLSLGVDDTAFIDPIAHRIRIVMTMGGVDYPLGIYMFADFTQAIFPSVTLSASSLVDWGFIVDQPLTESYGTRVVDISGNAFDTPVVVAIFNLITDLGFIIEIEESPFTASGTWSSGTSRAKVVDDLATIGDYFSGWFGNDEKYHVIRSFDPSLVVPTFNWDQGNTVFANATTESNDLINAPNRIVVISNGVNDQTTQSPIVGQYDIPYDAPHSIPNRGFVIPDIRSMDVLSVDQAQAAAENIGLQQTVYERTTVVTALDPRHDSYDVIFWRGEQWLELAWSMDLAPGGQMSHVLRRTYLP